MWITQKPDQNAPLDGLQGHAVGLKFECTQCHTEIFTDLLGVPTPDPMADSLADTDQYEKEEVKCPSCALVHTLEVDATFDGVKFRVSDAVEGTISYQLAEPKD